MMLFWDEGFLRKLTKIILVAAVVLFCWGWVSCVAVGGMTTGQYLHKIRMDLQHGVKTVSDKIFKYTGRVTGNVKTLRGPAVV